MYIFIGKLHTIQRWKKKKDNEKFFKISHKNNLEDFPLTLWLYVSEQSNM